jgi:hypothetical protein
MIKFCLRKLRKRLLGGDLCDVVATHDRDVRILAKQIGDLAEQIRQLDQSCKSMAVEIDLMWRELTYAMVNQAHLALRVGQWMSMKEANGDVGYSHPVVQQAFIQARNELAEASAANLAA